MEFWSSPNFFKRNLKNSSQLSAVFLLQKASLLLTRHLICKGWAETLLTTFHDYTDCCWVAGSFKIWSRILWPFHKIHGSQGLAVNLLKGHEKGTQHFLEWRLSYSLMRKLCSALLNISKPRGCSCVKRLTSELLHPQSLRLQQNFLLQLDRDISPFLKCFFFFSSASVCSSADVTEKGR